MSPLRKSLREYIRLFEHLICLSPSFRHQASRPPPSFSMSKVAFRLRHGEAAGAKADHRHVARCGEAKKAECFRGILAELRGQASDDHDVVELPRIAVGTLRRHLDAAARTHGVETRPQDYPVAVDLAAAVTLVGGGVSWG